MKALLVINDKKFPVEILGYEISQNVFEDVDVVINLFRISTEAEESIKKEISKEKIASKIEEDHRPSRGGIIADKSTLGKRFFLSEVNQDLFKQIPLLRDKRGIKILDKIPSVLNIPTERKVLITPIHNGGEEPDSIMKSLDELIDKESEFNNLSIFIETPVTVVEDGGLSFHLEEAVILYDLEDAKEVKKND